MYSVKPDNELAAALSLIAKYGLNQLPVVKDGKIVGMLSRADIIRYLQISQEVGAHRNA
jgi:predicted transcriptional regulator